MKQTQLIAGYLIKGSKVLAEVRKKSDKFGAGAIWIPGGHIEKNETPKQAFLREMKEELNIVPKKFSYYCKLPWKHNRKNYLVHYFVCIKWKGKIQNKEAAKLVWIGLKNLNKLSEQIDKYSVGIFLQNKNKFK
ncbi:MAG: NUDIX domain-containing protein [archaeon]|nr:NUDIX domain-containing protein [archaeon]